LKTIKALGIVLCLVLIISLGTVLVAARSVAPSDGTISITVTKYDVDGTTILAQETLTYTQMESTLPVQGDGETHYYFQGPTFDPDNLWDPDETLNLKNKGAIKGTDIKDLCELVGGAQDGDLIEIKAIDGYGDQFQYDNVYNPAPGQGKMVAAWYTEDAGDDHSLYPDGAYVPEFADGMQLIFLAETTNASGQNVFGHDDMRTYLPEDNWHYFYDSSIQYPSANGVSIKYISAVNIYTQPPDPWEISVTGAVTTTVGQSWFENALACHEVVTWTDSSENVWSGLPLWYLLGLSDDDLVHGLGSFNDALARAGYDIEVSASDGYTRTFRSEDVRRSSGYIVANQVNGAPLEADDYPLRLVGNEITSGRDRVGQIASINLLNIPDVETWTLELSGATDYTMRQTEFESAVYCPDIGHSAVYTEELAGTEVNTWEGLPLWVLVGWVDDDNQHGPGAFNDALADIGYDVRVIATDGFSYTFPISDVARNDNIIVASFLNDEPLPVDSYPLRMVGSDLTSGKQKVRQVARIELLNLPWTLELSGADVYTMTQSEFESTVPGYGAVYTEEVDLNGGTAIYEWEGLPLWVLAGWVDDDNQGPGTFNDQLADIGYDVRVIAADGFSYTFPISDVARNDNVIVANTLNDMPLPADSYPLRMVGSDLTSGKQKVKQIVKIELLDLPELNYVYLPLVFRNY
jgi:hypothetical protein